MKNVLFKRKLFFLFILAVIPLTVWSQTGVNIKGVVTDAATGEALIGVSVVQTGSSNGTVTDLDGQFTLNVPQGANLLFTYVGYESIELAATENMTVQLQVSQELLDEVVVIGYGIQKKSVVTAAISQVKAADLEKLTPTRIENVLKGQVSGVSITQGSGQPGSGSSIRIRGVGTTGDNGPLFIVDGMAVDGGIDNLNPADIASVEILKDAASAAVYGTRGGNGVILITTKSGREGKAKISYEMNIGYQNPWKKKELLTTEEYYVLQNELNFNTNRPLPYTTQNIADARAGLISNTDWQDIAFNKNTTVTNHQISVTGGTQKLSYYVSFGIFDQDGILGGNYDVSNYKRYTIRSNNSYEVFNVENERGFLNKIKVGSNVTYSRANSIGITTNQIWGTALGSATTLPPDLSPYLDKTAGEALLTAHPYALTDAQGRVLTPAPEDFQEIRNPLAVYLRPNHNYNNADKFIGSLWGEVNILKNLLFRTNYGFDLAFWGNDGYKYPYFQSENATAQADERTSTTSVWSSMRRGFTWQLENTLTYDLQLGDHAFTFLAGQSARSGTARYLDGTGYDLKVYDPWMAVINVAQMDTKEGGRIASGWIEDSRLASYFGRISYNYSERYMAQATIRRDGSYKFGKDNLWGNFPSFSLGWNVWNEPYLQNIRPDWWNNLKLRGSWGVNGSDRIDAWGYMSLMESGLNYYFGQTPGAEGAYGTLNYGISAGRIPNATLHWEESKQTDLGADFTFLRNSLTFSLDWFKKRTTGMLRTMQANFPDYVGQIRPLVNAGTVDNTGWEFDLGYRFTVAKDFNMGIKANASYVKNTLVDYGNATGENSWGNLAAAGIDNFIYQKNDYPNPFFFGYKTAGIIQNQEEADEYNFLYNQTAEPGDVRFVDTDRDNNISDADRVMIGKPIPDWTYGLTLTADYKGFDIYLFFQGVYGNEIFDISKRADIPKQNLPAWMLDRWHGEGTSDKFPRYTAAEANRNWRASDLYIKDGAYTRLKNIQLGYTIPSRISRLATIDRLRIWVGAENLLTFTKYDGFDPEIGDEQQGVDMGIYPQARTVSFGLGLTF
ncbi:MAG: TonB-dependent receptor [Dysgonamonadaceae bacterium]|jgi:TonB-linked SusC/RagA family outer membrane protein|nr:TonB-dependent receptor [Dysgonamonadaceae bacterium]